MAFLIAFSDIFYGIEVFNALTIHSNWSRLCIGVGGGLFMAMYVLDFSYWSSGVGSFLRRLGIAIVGAAVAVGAVVATDAYPECPMAV
eukprot:2417819-Prymnesium_polylepis.1